MVMHAPKNPRELFDYFRLYEQPTGISGLIQKWDASDVTPQQVYYSVLGRLPEGDRAKRGEDYDACAQYLNALRSDEFQSGIVKAVLNAYPDKKRMIFIHIPKCAGSHLNEKLIATFAAVNFRLMDRKWIDTDNFFDMLRILTAKLENSDTIAPYGHLPLKWYVNNGLIRLGDTTVSIVREPAQVVLSQVNYILTRFVSDPQLKAIDTNGWLPFIDKSKLTSSIASNNFRDLAIEILYSDALVTRDVMCSFLGHGTAKSAFELCASASVELTDLEHYPEWLRLRLGVDAGQATNVSKRYVTMEDIGIDGLERIKNVTEQDCILMDRVRTIMGDPNRCSISGVELL